jgi:hypothetical protein
MPEHKAHEFFGIAIWLLFLIVVLLGYSNKVSLAVELGIIGFVFCVLGSILPDIDEKHSIIFKKVRFLIAALVFVIAFVTIGAAYSKNTLNDMLFLLAICALMALAAVFAFYAIIPAHRGGIHSVLAAIVYSMFVILCSFLLLSDFWLSLLIAIFGFLSYFSHLGLDRSIKWV